MRRIPAKFILTLLLSAVIIPLLYGTGRKEPTGPSLTLYSGRGESLVSPLLQEFTKETGIHVNVRYGGTSELAVLLMEEGDRTPADIFWGQDAGAMGALAEAGLLEELPERLFADLPEIFKSRKGLWVATSGRARVLAYSSDRVSAASLPSSVVDLTGPEFRGRVGWSPTNGSFQSFVTALRVARGDSGALEWIRAMERNDAIAYRNNTALVEAIAAGEIDFALTNHYYLLRFLGDNPDFPVSQTFFEPGDIGNLINVAGIGITSPGRRRESNREAVLSLIEFLLDRYAQEYFATIVHEYPIRGDVDSNPVLEPFGKLLEVSPHIDLDLLEDLPGTLELLRDGGAL